MCILPQFFKKRTVCSKALPCRNERNPSLELKDEWMAGVKARPQGQGAGELGWDQSMQGMGTVSDCGLYLREWHLKWGMASSDRHTFQKIIMYPLKSELPQLASKTW